MTKSEIPDPTREIVQSRLDEWGGLEKYVLQEDCLNLLFQELLPGNENVRDVLIKVSALNDFYSTNIYDTHAVAKHIASLNITTDLAAGDLGLVNRVALVEIGGKVRRFYSFASKYCSHHHPEMYPIYDQYVEKVLLYFQKKSKFAKFKKSDLKEYNKFVAVIKEFSVAFKLDSFGLKQVDVYLWLTGKEYFNAYKE